MVSRAAHSFYCDPQLCVFAGAEGSHRVLPSLSAQSCEPLWAHPVEKLECWMNASAEYLPFFRCDDTRVNHVSGVWHVSVCGVCARFREREKAPSGPSSSVNEIDPR